MTGAALRAVDPLQDGEPALDRALAFVACRAAIKAATPLAREEMERLGRKGGNWSGEVGEGMDALEGGHSDGVILISLHGSDPLPAGLEAIDPKLFTSADWLKLSGFGDDSATYLWRVYGAREIMRLYREGQDELRRLARLQTAKASAEEVLHPPEETTRFGTPDVLRAAWDEDEIVDGLAAQGKSPSEDELKDIDKDIRRIVNEAAEFAQADPEPDPAELWTDIYAEA